MPLVWGIAVAAVGAGSWWWSIRLTLRAHKGRRLSWWATPPNTPTRAIIMRGLGAAVTVLGLGLLGTSRVVEPWAMGVIALILMGVPFFGAIAWHNSRLPRSEEQPET